MRPEAYNQLHDQIVEKIPDGYGYVLLVFPVPRDESVNHQLNYSTNLHCFDVRRFLAEIAEPIGEAHVANGGTTPPDGRIFP